MKLPWQEKKIVYTFKTGSAKGMKVEEVHAPWDLLLEGHCLNTVLGDCDHVLFVKNKLETIFSVRTEDRIPIMDIVCMPVKAKRHDVYWPKLRVFKTDNPMIVENERFIVLDVIGNQGKRPNKEDLQLAKDFYLRHDGVFDNKWPLGVAFNSLQDYKRWQKVIKGRVQWNLCIGGKREYTDRCQTQAFSLESAKDMLKLGYYDNLYINTDEEWAEAIFKYIKDHPENRPTDCIYGFGKDIEKRNRLLGRT